jgi:hypothetical protein
LSNDDAEGSLGPISGKAHAMHPVAPLTTERPVQKRLPKELLPTGMGIVLPRRRKPQLPSRTLIKSRLQISFNAFLGG